VRNVVYGFNDGLTANFGLVADTLSMGSSGYLAARSEQVVYSHEIAIERQEVRLMPEVEEEELSLIYQTRGMSEENARKLASETIRDPERALEEQIREKLRIGEAAAGYIVGDLVMRWL